MSSFFRNFHTFIKRLFSSFSLSAIRVVSSAYLRLLLFLPAILIPACASSTPAFHMMYIAFKLNKQGDNIQPWHSPFPIWNQSVGPCSVLTVASWPAYRFLSRQVRWSCPTLPPHGLYSPWNSPGQNTGVGSPSLLQEIFPTQGSNPGLPHCKWILHQLSYWGSPEGRNISPKETLTE